MKADKLADVLATFADAVNEIVDKLRDDADAPAGEFDQDGDYNEEVIQEKQGHEVDADAPADGDTVEVTYGDLWRLVNRSRKMIRFAREGKVPTMDQRAPLCRAIKTLKQQGAVRKPHNPKD